MLARIEESEIQPGKGLVSVRAAARDVGVHRATVFEWVADGRIVALRGSRGLLVRIDDVQRLKAARARAPANIDGKLLTAHEAAHLLGVTRRTVHNWVNKGKLRAVRLPSGALCIERCVVEALLHG
jgi:excisionase family DNA binding protein